MSVARPSAASVPWEGRSAAHWARRFSLPTVECHARIGSTSDRALALARAGSPLPALVLADRQSAGRGRRGRRWISDTPLGLWFTVARAREAGEAEAGALSLRVGLAAARAVEAVARGMRVDVKWPNDLLVDGRKLGGILCERLDGAVLAGIGLNVNQDRRDLPLGLAPPPTSVLLESGHTIPRARLLDAVMTHLAEVWARPGPSIPPAELEALEARSALRGRMLSVDGAVRRSSGRLRTAKGVVATATRLHPDGTLGLMDQAGQRMTLIAGSVSLESTLTPGS